MKTKTKSLFISYILACFVILGGFVYSNYLQTETYKLYLKNCYQHSFAELVNSVNEIDTALQKSLYATSPSMVSAVCTEVFGKSTSAQMAMSELPFSNYEIEQMSSFITKVGDYAYMLAKNAAGGAAYTEEEYKNLTALSEAATMMSGNLTQLLADINDGVITITELSRAQNEVEAASDSTTPAKLGDSIDLMENEFPETPSLIYDGPFSEHILQMKPRMLEGKAEISEDDALRIAAYFLGLKPELVQNNGTREGTVPVFILSAKASGGEVTIEVAKKGGIVINVTNSKIVTKAAISAEDAVSIAKRFLEKNGYPQMTESYWMVQGNTAIINFAYTQNDVICYTDLVKVTVALDNGNVSGFDALGYVMSHYQRDIPVPGVSETEAKKMVSENLNILSHSMTIIPTDGKNEVFCHEFKCESSDGRHYIVYINAITGVEQKILILLESENGTLTV